MHTVLGGGGVIGNGLARELRVHTERIRLVSRQPRAVDTDNELFPADLTDAAATASAVAGSDVVYLTAGLPYKTRVWEVEWPVIMTNVIQACRTAGARLVFFDNVYAYGRVSGPMTENTPVRPNSRKGTVRAHIAGMLMAAIERGEVQGMIARSADFYGPQAVNTFVHPMVFEKLVAGKRAAWLVNDHAPHSMTYTPDACRATALLGHTTEAFGTVWHLPTCAEQLTGRAFIESVAAACGTAPSYRVLKPSLLRIVALFDSRVRESRELLYQNADPYIFDSTRFEKRFFTATDYTVGIRETVDWVKRVYA